MDLIVYMEITKRAKYLIIGILVVLAVITATVFLKDGEFLKGALTPSVIQWE